MLDFELDKQFKLANRYICAPSKPFGFDGEVKQITNGMGRVVWGCDVRMDNRPDILKYGAISKWGIDRWVFEVKVNMAAFPRDEWEKSRYQIIEGVTKDVLGPRPHEIWGMKMPLVDFQNHAAYMPCDERFLEWLRANHYAWMTAPQGKFGSIQAYTKMIEGMDAEKREREASSEKNADEIAEYYNTHRDRINAEFTRKGVLVGKHAGIVTADGVPWSSEPKGLIH